MPDCWNLDQLQVTLNARRRNTLARDTKAAVLIPIIDDGFGPQRVVLTRRADEVKTHKGDVAFPGGFPDAADQDPIHTAIREAKEEIGLDPSEVEVLGHLDDFPTSIEGVQVTPVVARVVKAPSLTPDPREVSRVFEVPLRAFADRDAWRMEWMTRKGFRFPVYYYDHDQEVVWGLTGYITLHLMSFSPWGAPYKIKTDRFA